MSNITYIHQRPVRIGTIRLLSTDYGIRHTYMRLNKEASHYRDSTLLAWCGIERGFVQREQDSTLVVRIED